MSRLRDATPEGPRRATRPARRRHARPWRLPAAVLALSGALGPSAGAQEVRLEWSPPNGDVYAGQTFDLTLEVTVTRPAEGGLVQLFPQALGLPVQLEAFAGVEGLELLPGADGGEVSLVLDGEVSRADDLDPRDDVTRVRLTRRARARRPGAHPLPEPVGRFAVSSGFRPDLVRGEVPVDREDRVARGAAGRVEVLPLPEAGQPIEFDGAVGALEASVSLDRNRAVVGETLQLEVRFEGAWLEESGPEPRLAPVDGLEVQGRRSAPLAEPGREGRVYRYDLRVTSDEPDATPEVRITAFDPGASPPAYVVVRAPGLPIAVRRPAGAPAASNGSAQGAEGAPPSAGGTVATPAEAEGEDEEDGKPRLIWTPAVLAFIVLLAAITSLRSRRAGGGGPP